jgi:hypothetical protein
MSDKHYCDNCSKEMALNGSSGSILFGRSSGRDDGWLVTYKINREYLGRIDLCNECQHELLEKAVASRVLR